MRITVAPDDSQVAGFISWSRLAKELFVAGKELKPEEFVTRFEVSERGVNYFVGTRATMHRFLPDEHGRYNSAEHESLRAVVRCFVVNFGEAEGLTRMAGGLRAMDVRSISELSEWGANYLRKFLEKQLPLRGDYA